MSIFKCKICGGSLEIDSAQSVATCEYCGTRQTLPKLDDERRANLYDRANHFRRNNDFDKAMGIYENILNEDNTDAEAYWSIVLCRYGIEYVEDPATHKRVPTVNRAQFTSIFDDEDYKSAIVNADGYQREIYEAEATAINEIQKGILAISQKEEPFDVFVCYKETDTSGRRTQDSVLATELYHELTREGFKVFFSRITLEDKLGVAYEPYIFAALHSAKVMVVIGTRPEHFNAVWVKNEWSRFLALIKNGAKKTLIPAYRDMDPYDLPEEFSHLQAQDMSKLGFMQDLTRGIKKIVEAEAPKASVKETIAATATTLNVAPLLKRAFMFLEDGDFDRADEFCEQVLNQDPENAQAYLGKLMAELRVKRQADLANCAESFDNNKNYEKAVRFADTTLSSELRGYVATIKDRNARKAEEARKEALYLKAMDDYKTYDIQRLQEAIKAFTSLSGYKDSDERIRLCQSKIDQIRIKEENDRIESERLAEEKRIADEKARLEKQRQDEINRIEAQKRARRNKKIAMIASPIVVAVVVFIIILNSVIIPNGKYNDAVDLMNSGKYEEAISAFEALDGYKDSEIKIFECKYNQALALMDDEKYEEAIAILKSISGYGDSSDQISDCETTLKDMSYEKAISIYSEGKYEQAKEIFLTLNGYKESQAYITNCTDKLNEKNYNEALALFSSEKFKEAIDILTALGNYKDSQTKIKEIKFAQGEYLLLQKDFSSAIDIFTELGDYSTAKKKLIDAKYKYANHCFQKGQYSEAKTYYEQVAGYENADDMLFKASINASSLGSVIKFGVYEQDGNSSNGKEDIEWILLCKENGKALLISKYGLDSLPYDTSGGLDWKNSSLRTWLNNTFYNAAFDMHSKTFIKSTSIETAGVYTTDNVFILGRNEISTYYKSSIASLKVVPTNYAKNNNADYYSSYGAGWWWIRDIINGEIGFVTTTGSVCNYGFEANREGASVRPAIWIDISSIN